MKTAKTGTLPRPEKRRTLSGRLVDRLERRGFAWPSVGHGKHVDPEHPSRKHDVKRPQPVLIEVAVPVPGQPRRRDRRAVARHQGRHHEIAGSVGGTDYESECACGAFFTAPTSDLLREATAAHYLTAGVA